MLPPHKYDGLEGVSQNHATLSPSLQVVGHVVRHAIKTSRADPPRLPAPPTCTSAAPPSMRGSACMSTGATVR
eukprot:scaffold73953_cov32-Tisochrysis_lutea.AAC.5